MVRSHSQQKLELSHSQRKLDHQHKQFSSLQKDYDTVVGQISDWADTQRSSSEGLINKIKYIMPTGIFLVSMHVHVHTVYVHACTCTCIHASTLYMYISVCTCTLYLLDDVIGNKMMR